MTPLTLLRDIIVTTNQIKDVKMQSLTFSVHNIMDDRSRLQTRAKKSTVFC